MGEGDGGRGWGEGMGEGMGGWEGWSTTQATVGQLSFALGNSNNTDF